MFSRPFVHCIEQTLGGQAQKVLGGNAGKAPERFNGGPLHPNLQRNFTDHNLALSAA